MKQLISVASFLCFLVIATLAYATTSFGQNTPTITFEPAQAKPEPKKRTWDIAHEFSFKTKIESFNKVGIIESPTTAYSAMFTKSTTTREIKLQTTAGFTTKQFADDRYFNFQASVRQNLKSHAHISGDSEFTFTRFMSFGRVGGEVTKKFANHSADSEKFIRPYTRIDYYFPLGNHTKQTEFGHSGLTWSSGLAVGVDYKALIFENKNQFIFDSGALIDGRRTMFNTEGMFGYKVKRWCVGPMFEYTRLISGDLHQKNSFVTGFAVRYQ